MKQYVVSEQDVAAERADGDTAETRVTFDASNGCERLEQRVIRFGGGRSLERSLNGRQEVHCIENTGPGLMRIMGVFYPSGSPKQRSN